jgi:hypothetical protein
VASPSLRTIQGNFATFVDSERATSVTFLNGARVPIESVRLGVLAGATLPPRPVTALFTYASGNTAELPITTDMAPN